MQYKCNINASMKYKYKYKYGWSMSSLVTFSYQWSKFHFVTEKELEHFLNKLKALVFQNVTSETLSQKAKVVKHAQPHSY